MTSWPWMKGIEVAIANPIEPVCPEDDRPSVKALILEHSEKITKIKAALVDHPLYNAEKHDDLWILRFWLSHKKSKTAIEAAQHTLEFREKHQLDQKDIRDVAPHQVQVGKVKEYLDCWEDDAMIFTHPNPQRGVICFFQLASMNQHAVVEKLTEDHWHALFMYCSEWVFQWLDYVTRTSGRLTKSVRFANVAGFSMRGFNPECTRRDGSTSALLEDHYPQLLEAIFVCNPPIFVGILWKIARVILPKRVVSKIDFMNPKQNPKQRKRFFRHISEDDLPDFYGGNNSQKATCW